MQQAAPDRKPSDIPAPKSATDSQAMTWKAFKETFRSSLFYIYVLAQT